MSHSIQSVMNISLQPMSFHGPFCANEQSQKEPMENTKQENFYAGAGAL